MICATYGSGGRLGDNILLYCKAKYLSYKHGKPLRYNNFPFFDQLNISVYETQYQRENNIRHIRVNNAQVIPSYLDSPTIFDIDYYCKMTKKNNLHGSYVGCKEFPFDWVKKKMVKYQEFGAELKRNLQIHTPRNTQIHKAGDCITVAVSTRMGTSIHDDPALYSEQFFEMPYRYGDLGFAFKFVPQQFYINQVKRLSALLQHRKMHIHFFIDKEKDYAANILAQWRIALADYKNITLECNIEGTWEQRTLDDLYIMSHCSCLIRGCSHFAGIAQLAGDHLIIIGPNPASYIWEGRRLIFTKTFIYFQNALKNTFQQFVYEDTPIDILQSLALNLFA
jgi:hypothetical protein